MDTYAVWAVVLLGIALILVIVELFIPSGGLIALCAAASTVGGVVMLFQVNRTLGLVGAIVAVLGVPFIIALSLRVWPHTPIAKMLTIETPTRDPDAPPMPNEDGPKVGAHGKALTDLRPVGTCLIDGKRLECLAEAGVIRAGSAVKVILSDGLQVKVRAEQA
jgi:membrane-bound ClpP family serine protease